ncbi:hypothetical protein RUM44_005297 [Polyplax serrata]|uniref:Aminopeptidase n=1 Tax=Polyplax serrata TaxID=468196 RepID=A0ABR1AEL1_POLSC
MVELDGTAKGRDIYTTHIKSDKFLNITCDRSEISQTRSLFRVEVLFKNILRNDMTGFYRSSYITPTGEKRPYNKMGSCYRWLLTTHFEPIHARNAFPCFDLPNLKAYFTVTISFPSSLHNYHALCNTLPKETVSKDGKQKIVSCSKSRLVMPTYLVAFTISDFSRTKTVTFESDYPVHTVVDIVTHGRKAMIDNNEGQLSVDAAKEAVISLGNYTQRGYAFEKIDMVGIPDFGAGAMENWGLITYREKILFHNEQKASVSLKQGTVLTVVHELVHQWFGNLVTLAHWNYIWLNEAFANYLSYVIADTVRNPNTADWNYLGQLLVNEIHLQAFEVDGLTSAKPLTQDIKDESLYTSAFDDIPYAKGSSILRMWDLSLPDDTFRQSLVKYIKKRSEQSVQPYDLFEAFNQVAGMQKHVFQGWTENPGYPVVDVKKSASGEYILTQSRFFFEKIKTPQAEIIYPVPVTYTVPDSKNPFNPKPLTWLQDATYKLNLSGEWFIINNLQAGYYRVNYEKNNWLALAKALNKKDHSKIHENNRAQIINDVFSLARSVYKNYVDYDTALSVSQYLTKEKSYIVWRTALDAFEFLYSKLSHDAAQLQAFKKFAMKLLTPHYVPLRDIRGSHLDRLMGRQISRWACRLGHKPCLDEAMELYTNASYFPEVEDVILCTVTSSNSSIWNEILQKYKTELDSSRKLMYLTSMGCTTDRSKIDEYLATTLKGGSDIRKQDCLSALASVYRGNSENVEIAMQFIENNFIQISQQYGGINDLGKAITDIATKLHQESDIQRMEALVKKIKESSLAVPPDNLHSSVSIVKSNVEWIQEKAKTINFTPAMGYDKDEIMNMAK